MTVFDRIVRAYAALTGKAVDPNSPLGRLHPELTTREHLTAWPGRIASETADDYVGYARTYAVYVWMRKAITVIVENAAPLPIRVVGMDGTPIINHPLMAVLTQPNQQMDSAELWAIAWTHKLLGGEWFLEAVEADRTSAVPAELWPRRPDLVGIAPDKEQEHYPIPAGYEITGIEALLPPKAMIHEKFLNPLSDWRGLSPAGALREGITIDLYAQGYAKHFLRNNARPDYAIESKMALTTPEIERMELQIAQKYGGGRGATKPMVLEGGQTIHVLSFPPKDTEWLKQREMSREEVGSLYGVPDEIMGWGRDTYENFDTALRVFWLLTLLPMVQRRDATLTNFFTLTRKALRSGERIVTDLTGVSVLQEALGPKIEQALKLWQMGVPFNVIEQTLKLGIGAVPGGETGYLSTSLAPIVRTDAEAGAPAPQATPILGYHIESGVVSRNEARAQLGLSPEDESTDERLRRLQAQLSVAMAAVGVGIDTNQALALVGIDLQVPQPVPIASQTLHLPAPIAKSRASRAAEELRRIRAQVADELETDVGDYFLALADRVEARAQSQVTRSARRNGHGTAVLVKELMVEGLLLPDDDALLLAILEQHTIEIARVSWATWNTSLGVQVAFEETDPAVVAALAQAGTRIPDISETTRQFLAKVLQDSADAGLSQADTIKGLRLIIEEGYQNRAKAIARTEMGFAQNAVAAERYAATGVERVLIFDNGQDDPDDECAALNGSVQTLEWFAANPLGHPNCTRAAGPYFGT